MNEFIDGNPLIFIDGNPLLFIGGVQQLISMDFQFFEIQFFEKTIKKTMENNEAKQCSSTTKRRYRRNAAVASKTLEMPYTKQRSLVSSTTPRESC